MMIKDMASLLACTMHAWGMVSVSVTLLLEKQHKEFTSDKSIFPLQFGTIIHIISLTFKTIK